MEIVRANNSGFCFGVRRAVDMVSRLLEKKEGPIYTIGPIIHNPDMVRLLEEKGVIPVEDVKEVVRGTVVFRTHGILKEEEDYIRSKRIKAIDATCPFVKRVRKEACKLKKSGYKVVIVGDREHQEVKSILSYVGNDGIVIEHPQEIKGKKIGIVSQTTQSREVLKKVVDRLLETAEEIKVVNTICEAVERRLKEAISIAEIADVMIVVGGKESSNTKKLFKAVKNVRPRSYHVENEEDLDPLWFKGVRVVGLTGGTSTPDFIMDRVYYRIKNVCGGKDG
ncbi:MAG: 4-hydroxy-3-methylbut-2-enyl diphosphate reductase [Desulfobacterota bacterium]|nr:4-hydroxy-3-methylbut-2-enyl diphosphate reductase [Thermodesulfobacteriota bacterium]MDW8001896.1 4-hydroxy-3-methylbut-2-enyl diphosphate reductase [Deltaproteobacteria bacterium]